MDSASYGQVRDQGIVRLLWSTMISEPAIRGSAPASPTPGWTAPSLLRICHRMCSWELAQPLSWLLLVWDGQTPRRIAAPEGPIAAEHVTALVLFGARTCRGPAVRFRHERRRSPDTSRLAPSSGKRAPQGFPSPSRPITAARASGRAGSARPRNTPAGDQRELPAGSGTGEVLGPFRQRMAGVTSSPRLRGTRGGRAADL